MPRLFAIDDDRFKYGSRFSTRYFDELLAEIRETRASERMAYQKITDIYATSVDYSKDAEEKPVNSMPQYRTNCILPLLGKRLRK